MYTKISLTLLAVTFLRAQDLPVVTAHLAPGTSTWAARIQVGEQTTDMTVKVDVKESAEGWVISHIASQPSGDAVDIATLDKKTLAFIKRDVTQGPLAIHFEVKGSRVAGSISMNGQEKPIDADAGGPLFADGSGGRLSIVCLPLAEGYTTTFRNFDLQQMKSKIMRLKVGGSEKVTAPAGSFDTWRVEIAPAEGGPVQMTLWVAKDSRKAVRMATTMGRANVTAQLQ